MGVPPVAGDVHYIDIEDELAETTVGTAGQPGCEAAIIVIEAL